MELRIICLIAVKSRRQARFGALMANLFGLQWPTGHRAWPPCGGSEAVRHRWSEQPCHVEPQRGHVGPERTISRPALAHSIPALSFRSLPLPSPTRSTRSSGQRRRHPCRPPRSPCVASRRSSATAAVPLQLHHSTAPTPPSTVPTPSSTAATPPSSQSLTAPTFAY